MEMIYLILNIVGLIIIYFIVKAKYTEFIEEDVFYLKREEDRIDLVEDVPDFRPYHEVCLRKVTKKVFGKVQNVSYSVDTISYSHGWEDGGCV